MTAYTYEDCTVSKIVDGDTVYFNLKKTFKLDVDFGFHIIDHMELTKTSVQDFRLAGINTPEVVGESKAKGLEAKAELTRLLSLGSIKVVSEGRDKYGRWLATIFVKLPDGTELNVNQKLVESGHAVVYNL